MYWNWDHLRFFLALAEHGTLSSAARSLDVSHSTVLRRIRQMESQLSAHLFEPTHSGYQLTKSGQTLFVEAVKMQGTISALSREISGTDSHMEGEIIITTTDTLARHILPKLLSSLTTQFPKIKFSLYMANRLSDMNNRKVDIAIRTCKIPPDNLIGRKVGEINFATTASKNYALENKLSDFPENLSHHKIITLDESFAAATFYQWLNERKHPQTQVTSVNNFLCAAALAKQDMGITVLPSYVVEQEMELIELKSKQTIGSSDLWVLSHVNTRNSSRVRAICRILYDELSDMFNDRSSVAD